MSTSRLEQIQKMLASEPEDIFLNFSLAMELAKLRRFDEAVAQYRRLHELAPDYVPAFFQRGNTLVAAGDTDGARQALEEGIAVARRVGDQHAADEMQGVIDML